MNYQEEFTENELKEYEVVKDWKAFAKQYITNQNHDIYISKKIFLEEISFIDRVINKRREASIDGWITTYM